METDLVSIEKQNMKTISNCWRRVIGRFWLNRFNRAATVVKIAMFAIQSPEREADKCIISGNNPVATNAHLPTRTHLIMKYRAIE